MTEARVAETMQGIGVFCGSLGRQRRALLPRRRRTHLGVFLVAVVTAVIIGVGLRAFMELARQERLRQEGRALGPASRRPENASTAGPRPDV